jgi:hypothetical protein
VILAIARKSDQMAALNQRPSRQQGAAQPSWVSLPVLWAVGGLDDEFKRIAHTRDHLVL